ncbi:MAG: alcohol dehydrogenase catalytic domain-containing protein, partial [Chloroflexi bacterium]|nr:alcohol dehydrogenase catalytic domain-containing protein [Chloroflexota bacterium]
MTDNTQMRAALLYGVGDIRVEDRPIPTPGPEDVQVAVRYTGVCGTDLHHFDGWDLGDVIPNPPPRAH